MDDNAALPPPTPAPFDVAAYIRTGNETEAARRAGKPIEAKPAPAPAEPAKPAEHMSRSDRRAQNNLREMLGAERGKRELLEQQIAELQKTGKPAAAAPPIEDVEPRRAAFATDSEYTRAVTAYDRRQEAKTAAAQAETAAENEGQIAELRAEIAAADAKMTTDIKLIPDWDEVQQAAKANEEEDQPTFFEADHLNLMRMLATSDVRAFMLHHLAKNPAEMQKLLDATGNFEKQLSMFRRLEGRVEKLHSSAENSKAPEKNGAPEKPEPNKPAEKAPETAAERDARKARPSEAAAAQGGSAPANDIAPVLADGVTINPAWKALQNTRAQGRR